MPESRGKNSFSVGVAALLLAFLACLTLLAVVYGRCAALSRENRQLNCAVDTCRSAAEAFAAGGLSGACAAFEAAAPGDGDTALIPLDGDWKPCGEAEAAFCLLLARQEDPSRPGLFTCEVSAFRGAEASGNPIYTLTSARYSREGGAAA